MFSSFFSLIDASQLLHFLFFQIIALVSTSAHTTQTKVSRRYREAVRTAYRFSPSSSLNTEHWSLPCNALDTMVCSLRMFLEQSLFAFDFLRRFRNGCLNRVSSSIFIYVCKSCKVICGRKPFILLSQNCWFKSMWTNASSKLLSINLKLCVMQISVILSEMANLNALMRSILWK